jgi:general secretion pathway protein G
MRRGFTLIELMVVMAVVALLVTIVAPRYLTQTDRAREAVLRNNLKETRDAIDKFYTDNGRYPQSLKELVDGRYLKMLPLDPINGRNDRWTLTGSPSGPIASSQSGGIYDLHSSATGHGLDGTAFTSW